MRAPRIVELDRAAADRRDNLLGELAAACALGEVDVGTAQAMLVILFAAGGESTASLPGSAAWILAKRPDVQRHVRENPQLLTAFIEETLRYEPPFRGHHRHVRNDTTLAGFDLPADSRLLLLWGAARPTSRRPKSSASIARNPRGTSVLAREPTSVSVPLWRA